MNYKKSFWARFCKRFCKDFCTAKCALFLLCMAFALLCISCASIPYWPASISANFERPAQIDDLDGASSISVFPILTHGYTYENGTFSEMMRFLSIIFGLPDRKSEEQGVANSVYASLVSHFASSAHYTFIDSRDVEFLYKRYKKEPCELYIEGSILQFESNIKEYVNEELVPLKDKNGKVIKDENGKTLYKKIFVKTYKHFVNGTLRLCVVDARKTKVLATKYFNLEEKSSAYDSLKKLPSASSLLDSQIKKCTKQISQLVEPYTVRKNYELLRDKDKIPELEEANRLAKDASLRLSEKIYADYYQKTKNLVAGYNASVLLLAQGDFEDALTLANDVYKQTGNSVVQNLIAEIETEIFYKQKRQRQKKSFDDKRV